ncbi:MAG: ECF transporter S component [Clostridia bacterium]|nr:ECF transporter S component [Clostridia bacterium]
MSGTTNKFSVFTMTRIAALTALSAVLFLTVEIPIVAFYKLDFSNLPALLGAFAMGPLPALIILVLKTGIHLLIKGLGSTIGIGDLADLIMSVAFVLPAALIYSRNKNRKSALVGMATGTLCTIVVGVLVNWLVLIPAYMAAYHMDINAIVGMATKTLPFVDTEWKLLLFVTAPFNLLKGIVISLITFLIYKPLSPILHMKTRQ